MWSYKAYNDKAPDPSTPEIAPESPARLPPKFSWRSLVGETRLKPKAGNFLKLLLNPPSRPSKTLLEPGGNEHGDGSPASSKPSRLPTDPGTVDEIVELLAELIEERRKKRENVSAPAGNDDEGGGVATPASLPQKDVKASSKKSGGKAPSTSTRASSRKPTPSPDDDEDEDTDTDEGHDTLQHPPSSHGASRPSRLQSKPPSQSPPQPSQPSAPSSSRPPPSRQRPASSATHTPQSFDWPDKEQIQQSLAERSLAGDDRTTSLAHRTTSTIQLPTRTLDDEETDTTQASDFSSQSDHPSQDSFDVHLPSAPKHDPGVELPTRSRGRTRSRGGGDMGGSERGRPEPPNQTADVPPLVSMTKSGEHANFGPVWQRTLFLMTESLELAKQVHSQHAETLGSSSKNSPEMQLLELAGSYFVKHISPLQQAAALFSQADIDSLLGLMEHLIGLKSSLAHPESQHHRWNNARRGIVYQRIKQVKQAFLLASATAVFAHLLSSVWHLTSGMAATLEQSRVQMSSENPAESLFQIIPRIRSQLWSTTPERMKQLGAQASHTEAQGLLNILYELATDAAAAALMDVPPDSGVSDVVLPSAHGVESAHGVDQRLHQQALTRPVQMVKPAQAPEGHAEEHSLNIQDQTTGGPSLSAEDSPQVTVTQRPPPATQQQPPSPHDRPDYYPDRLAYDIHQVETGELRGEAASFLFPKQEPQEPLVEMYSRAERFTRELRPIHTHQKNLSEERRHRGQESRERARSPAPESAVSDNLSPNLSSSSQIANLNHTERQREKQTSRRNMRAAMEPNDSVRLKSFAPVETRDGGAEDTEDRQLTRRVTREQPEEPEETNLTTVPGDVQAEMTQGEASSTQGEASSPIVDSPDLQASSSDESIRIASPPSIAVILSSDDPEEDMKDLTAGSPTPETSMARVISGDDLLAKRDAMLSPFAYRGEKPLTSAEVRYRFQEQEERAREALVPGPKLVTGRDVRDKKVSWRSFDRVMRRDIPRTEVTPGALTNTKGQVVPFEDEELYLDAGDTLIDGSGRVWNKKGLISPGTSGLYPADLQQIKELNNGRIPLAVLLKRYPPDEEYVSAASSLLTPTPSSESDSSSLPEEEEEEVRLDEELHARDVSADELEERLQELVVAGVEDQPVGDTGTSTTPKISEDVTRLRVSEEGRTEFGVTSNMSPPYTPNNLSPPVSLRRDPLGDMKDVESIMTNVSANEVADTTPARMEPTSAANSMTGYVGRGESVRGLTMVDEETDRNTSSSGDNDESVASAEESRQRREDHKRRRRKRSGNHTGSGAGANGGQVEEDV